MIQIKQERTLLLFLFIFCLFIFTRSLSVHGLEYRDDEIFYFQSTNEMLNQENYFSPTYFGEDRFQKPILFYWLILLSYKIFGVSWFSARFVASFFAALSVCATFFLAKEFFSRRVSILSAFIVMSLPLFLRHAKNVVPDMPLNFFIVTCLYCAVIYLKDPAKKSANILFYVLCAMAFMVKGFSALIPVVVILLFLLISKKVSQIKTLRLGRGLLLWLCVVAPWFIYMINVHGSGYLEYMLVEETKERILGYEYSKFIIVQAKRFIGQSLFYLRSIASYFLPWSLIGLFAIPFVCIQRGNDEGVRDGLNLCLIWMAVVFFIFSNMYFAISHYMLIMSAPFAIVVSYFILEGFREENQQRTKQAIVDIYIMIFLGIGIFAFAFLTVFLAGYSKLFFILLGGLYVSMLWILIKKRDPISAPFMISLFVVFIFSQSALFAKAGVTSHGTLQLFAQTIKAGADESAIVGVGSHDIHEKEFQVYFDEKIVKAGHSHEGAMKQKLGRLFNNEGEVYCLLTQKDYNDSRVLLEPYSPKIIQEEFLVRKRMNLDKGFLSALIKLDQNRVRAYLMEKVILIKKEANG